MHKNFYVKSFKITPTCFDPKIIFRELKCSLLRHIFKKHSLINFLILTWFCGSMSYCVGRRLLRMRLTVGVCRVLCCERLAIASLSQHNTQKTYIHTYTHIYTHIHTHTYIHTYIRIHTHIHTHI